MGCGKRIDDRMIEMHVNNLALGCAINHSNLNSYIQKTLRAYYDILANEKDVFMCEHSHDSWEGHQDCSVTDTWHFLLPLELEKREYSLEFGVKLLDSDYEFIKQYEHTSLRHKFPVSLDKSRVQQKVLLPEKIDLCVLESLLQEGYHFSRRYL